MYKHYVFRLRGNHASRVFNSLRTDERMKSIAFAAQDRHQKAELVRAARKVSRAERSGGVEVNKDIHFYASRISYRRSRSGYQVVLPNIPLGWETSWGLSSADNRCSVCGWPINARQPPAEVHRCSSCRLFSSMDGYLVVWGDIVDRFEQEQIGGVRFLPVHDPDVEQLTVSVYSGSFEVSRRRLLEEFPSSMRSSGELPRFSSESVRTLMGGIETALGEQYESRRYTERGIPEDITWIRLPPWMQDEAFFRALERFGKRFVEREMMDFRVYPPPPPARESKWYVLLPDEPIVPEHESTIYNSTTACPECGLRPTVEGPLRLAKHLVEGRDVVETSSNWIVASDRVCKILRQYDPFAMSAVTLVE